MASTASILDAAQQTLVNTAIRAAVDKLYEDCARNQWVVTGVLKDGRELGATKAEVMQTLLSIRKEFERVRVFNLLAKENGFDLSLKTAGPKSEESIARKRNIMGKGNKPLSDIVRMTVVSSDVALLDSVAETIHRELSKKSPAAKGLKQEIEDWSISGSALLRKVLKNNVSGLGAEIQFLPREQSRMAARITHHFFKITRAYNDAMGALSQYGDMDVARTALIEKSKTGTPESMGAAKQEAAILSAKIKNSAKAIDDYAEIACFMNKLGSNQPMSIDDMHSANKILVRIERSTQTFDESTEGDLPNSQAGNYYSPIFKTMSDIKSYRNYMRAHGDAIGLFPLPIIHHESSRKEVAAAMMQLQRCNQLTHACYMNSAKEPFRNLWVKEALEANENLAPEHRIPDGAIAAVNHTLDLSALKKKGKGRE